MLSLQLGGVFDGHEPFVERDELRERVEHRRFARTRSAGDEEADASVDRGGEKLDDFMFDRLALNQIFKALPVFRGGKVQSHG